MNVAELIQELQKLPLHAPVHFDGSRPGGRSGPEGEADEPEVDFIEWQGRYVLLTGL